ncbi:MAG: hypothetical protein A3F67_10960 [Verrucomicrobia bacterium RIFCSPHIGHO2_12_FULL_41_10]|nr:MAG: hypothetical protein A3F67_10960 [Verrucomicrobia bacterium RIFCSPHIGHO2_12_FULL_41_10]
MAQVHAEVGTRPSKLNRSDRPVRTPINGQRGILTVRGQEEGYHYCWVNEDNVDRYEEGSYEFVSHDVIVGDKKLSAASMGSKISKKVGNDLVAYLMRCPNEVYEDELRGVEEKTADTEQTILKSGQHSDGFSGKVLLSNKEVV